MVRFVMCSFGCFTQHVDSTHELILVQLLHCVQASSRCLHTMQQFALFYSVLQAVHMIQGLNFSHVCTWNILSASRLLLRSAVPRQVQYHTVPILYPSPSLVLFFFFIFSLSFLRSPRPHLWDNSGTSSLHLLLQPLSVSLSLSILYHKLHYDVSFLPSVRQIILGRLKETRSFAQFVYSYYHSANYFRILGYLQVTLLFLTFYLSFDRMKSSLFKAFLRRGCTHVFMCCSSDTFVHRTSCRTDCLHRLTSKIPLALFRPSRWLLLIRGSFCLNCQTYTTLPVCSNFNI